MFWVMSKKEQISDNQGADFARVTLTSEPIDLQYMIQHFLRVVTMQAQLSWSASMVTEDGIVTLKVKGPDRFRTSSRARSPLLDDTSDFSYLLGTLTANSVHNGLSNDRVSGFAGPYRPR